MTIRVMRRFVTLILALLAIPLTAMWIGDDQRNADEQRFLRDPVRATDARLRHLSLAEACASARPQPSVSFYCRRADERAALRVLALASICGTIPPLILGAALPRRVARSGHLDRLAPALAILLCGITAVSAVDAAIFSLEARVIAPDTWVATALGIGSAVSVLVLAVCLLQAVWPDPLRIVGATATRAEQPALWRLVDEAAARLRVTPPEHLVLHLGRRFTLQHAPLQLAGRSDRVRPRSLVLSLPMMRILSREELLATIGHELGHTRGQGGAAVFIRLAHAAGNTAERLREWGLAASLLLPARRALELLIAALGPALVASFRASEVEADAASVLVAGKDAVASNLGKLTFCAWYWESVEENQIDLIREGRMRPNLSEYFGTYARDVIESSDRAAVIEKVAQCVTASDDIYPALPDRLGHMGMTLDMGFAWFDGVQCGATDLVVDADRIETELTKEHAIELATTGRIGRMEPQFA